MDTNNVYVNYFLSFILFFLLFFVLFTVILKPILEIVPKERYTRAFEVLVALSVIFSSALNIFLIVFWL
jgi:ABC-type Na+ efflux pump permease subunit